jgi:hypothetical protein
MNWHSAMPDEKIKGEIEVLSLRLANLWNPH